MSRQIRAVLFRYRVRTVASLPPPCLLRLLLLLLGIWSVCNFRAQSQSYSIGKGTHLSTMAALFRGIVDTMTKSAPETTTTRKDKATVVASPRSYHLPAYPMASEWDERHRSSNPSAASGAPLGRIAHWDKKREKCHNCKHIYLKTLSRHPGFCSVDCKSNAAYIDKVNRTIKAVRNAVEQLQQDKEEEEEEQQEQEQEQEKDASVVAKSSNETEAIKCLAPGQAHTFAEFGIETRLSNDQNVEWAFSAVY